MKNEEHLVISSKIKNDPAHYLIIYFLNRPPAPNGQEDEFNPLIRVYPLVKP